MSLLIGTILVASLLGSLHCAGMCGAFVAIATGELDASPRRKVMLQTAYHVGRLVTYMTMGVLAGTLGALVDVAGRLAGVQTAATMLAGAVMVTFGVVSILRIYGVHISLFKLPTRWQTVVSGLHRRSMRYSPLTRAGLIGLLTTLLPCGWLYAFVVTAAGTGHPLKGAIAMAAFWIGTLPVLVSLGAGVQTLLGTLGRKVPALTCLLLIGVGLYTLIGRGHMNAIAVAARVSPTTQPNDAAPDEVPACCQHE